LTLDDAPAGGMTRDSDRTALGSMHILSPICFLLALTALTWSLGNNNNQQGRHPYVIQSNLRADAALHSARHSLASTRKIVHLGGNLMLRGGDSENDGHNVNEPHSEDGAAHSLPVEEKLSNLELDNPESGADSELETLVSQLESNLKGVNCDDDISAAYEAERKLLQEDAELFPDHLPSLYNYGRFLQSQKQVDQAIELYNKCLLCDAKEPWKEGLAHTFCNYGLILHLDHKNLTGAEYFYKAALSINPNHVCALNNYGKLLEGSERTSSRQTIKTDLDGAENLYSRALAADPDHVPTLVNFAYFKEKVSYSLPHHNSITLVGLSF
jgi:tetratricopeptide (TPR) repeat protein